jgi:sulfur carrier protein
MLTLGQPSRVPCYSRGEMQLTINGEARTVPDGLSVRALIEHLGLTEGPVAVEKNREIVPRAEHENTPVENGDTLEIVHFVGGG